MAVFGIFSQPISQCPCSNKMLRSANDQCLGRGGLVFIIHGNCAFYIKETIVALNILVTSIDLLSITYIYSRGFGNNGSNCLHNLVFLICLNLPII